MKLCSIFTPTTLCAVFFAPGLALACPPTPDPPSAPSPKSDDAPKTADTTADTTHEPIVVELPRASRCLPSNELVDFTQLVPLIEDQPLAAPLEAPAFALQRSLLDDGGARELRGGPRIHVSLF